MSLIKIKNPRIASVSLWVVCISTGFLIDFLVWHDSPAAALFQGVSSAIFIFGCSWWFARRRARS